MEGLMKSMLDKLPPWAYQVFAVVIAAGMIFYFVKTLYINKKLSDMVADVMRRDDRMQDIQLRMDELRSAQIMHEHTAQQTLSALRDVKPFMDTLNDIRAIADPYAVLTETSFLLQRMLDILAVDMKLKAGGHHRCGIWLHAEQMLTLRFASAGFPKHYVGERQLHVDRSVAGRSYRKQAIVQIADVTKDEDWERNTDSKSPYQALMCLPLGTYGVLTIDGLEPFHDSGRAIGEIYASLSTGIIAEYIAAYRRWSQTDHGSTSFGTYGVM